MAVTVRAPLGWQQLRHRPLRLLVALLGIAFAVLLIMMQLGFRSALFESAVRVHERFSYDIALFSPDSVFIVRPQPFSLRRLYQALADESVTDVAPVYIFPATWKDPWATDIELSYCEKATSSSEPGRELSTKLQSLISAETL